MAVERSISSTPPPPSPTSTIHSVFAPGADPGFSWGGGGGQTYYVCARTHHDREAQSPLRPGCYLSLFLRIWYKMGKKELSIKFFFFWGGGGCACCAPIWMHHCSRIIPSRDNMYTKYAKFATKISAPTLSKNFFAFLTMKTVRNIANISLSCGSVK